MATMPEWWTVPYPEVSSARTATDYLDAIGAALNRYEDDGLFVLATGPQELIRTDRPEELDTFVLGFALAHLICERYGLIGTRPPPEAAPEPAPPPASPEPPPDPPVTEAPDAPEAPEAPEAIVFEPGAAGEPVVDGPPSAWDDTTAPTLVAVADYAEPDEVEPDDGLEPAGDGEPAHGGRGDDAVRNDEEADETVGAVSESRARRRRRRGRR